MIKIAYLTNQYPKISHSFIRREILALEKKGVEILRFTIRSTSLGDLVDSDDLRELEKTFALLEKGAIGLLLPAIFVFMSQPIRFIKALSATISLGFHGKRGVIRHIAYLGEACLLKRKLSGNEVKHIHAHFGTNSATVAYLCYMIGGPSYSFTVHGPEEFDDPKGYSLGKKIDNCKFVVAVSSFGKSQLMRQCSLNQWPKIRVIHCSVDNAFIQECETPMPSTPRLICVGRLCEQKGQLLLIEAANILNSQGVEFQLILAGDGEMRSSIEDLVNKYNLHQKVEITGWLSGKEVKTEILSSKALVLPSFAEGLPVVIMESLALKRPVVTTFIAGIPELVEHEINGWLIPAGSVTALAETLKTVLETDEYKLLKMGNHGAIKVRERHNDDIEAEKLLRIFVEL